MKKYAPLLILTLALAVNACSQVAQMSRPNKEQSASPPESGEGRAAQTSTPAKTDSTPGDIGAAKTSSSPSDHHIALKYAFKTGAPPDRVYSAITGVAHWWDPKHTYSGNASNLTLDARAGGCWCEQLGAGGSVQHMSVLAAMPPRLLRLSGGLGPLQSGAVNAVMTWTIKRDGEGSEVDMTYLVDGYFPGGLEALHDGVDGVLSHQVERLRAYIDAK